MTNGAASIQSLFMRSFLFAFFLFLGGQILPCCAQFDFSESEFYSTKAESVKWPVDLALTLPKGWDSAWYSPSAKVFMKRETEGLMNLMQLRLFELPKLSANYTAQDLRREVLSRAFVEDMATMDAPSCEILEYKIISDKNPIVLEFSNTFLKGNLVGYSAARFLLLGDRHSLLLKYSFVADKKSPLISDKKFDLKAEFMKRKSGFEKVCESLKVKPR